MNTFKVDWEKKKKHSRRRKWYRGAGRGRTSLWLVYAVSRPVDFGGLDLVYNASSRESFAENLLIQTIAGEIPPSVHSLVGWRV